MPQKLFGEVHVHGDPWRVTVKLMLFAVFLGTLLGGQALRPQAVHASTSATASPLIDGTFEQGPQQAAWSETQSSGGELIDQFDPNSGVWAADLCNIDNCTDGHGNPGDTLVQSFVSPGQIVSAQLSYSYNIATSEPDQNASCKDRLTVGIGLGLTPDPGASRRYCAPTGAQYHTDSLDVTTFLQSHGGQTVNAQLEGFTNTLYPTEFFVDDVSLTITYLLTPSAPVVTPISDCSTGTATISWSVPQFPLGNQWPVQSYLVTPYSVSGAAQQGTTVSGGQTSLAVDLHGGTVCYFTVTATNANGVGPAGSPTVPVTAVSPPTPPQSTGFALNWTRQPASATATSYTVFIRDGSGPWLKWGDTTTMSSMVYGAPGHTYAYYVEGFNASGGGGPPSGSGQASVTIPLSATHTIALKGLYGVDYYGNLHPAESPPLAQTASWSWPIARGIAMAPSGSGGYVVDGWGAVHPFGTAPAAAWSSYWSGWDIARAIAVRPDGASGYVLDGWGGLHPFGGAPTLTTSAYWYGWDIARGLVLDASGNGGYVLDGWGGLHPFGDAQPVSYSSYWHGWDIARGVVLRVDGRGGYVLDGWGGVHPFGNAPSVAAAAYWRGWDICRGIVLAPSGDGGYVLDGFGGFHPFGSVTSAAVTPNYAGADIMRGMGGA